MLVLGPVGGSEVDNMKFSGAWTPCYSPEEKIMNFKWMAMEADYDSFEMASPPLWKSAGSPITPQEMTQAIAQCQQEMLDMVRELPECDYELSMKDLVELSTGLAGKSTLSKGKELPKIMIGTEKEKHKKSTRFARKVTKTESMDHGVLRLKLFLPFPNGLRRSLGTGNTSSRFSPRNPGLMEKIKEGDRWGKGDNKPRISYKRMIFGRLLRTIFFRRSYSSSSSSSSCSSFSSSNSRM